MSTFKTSLLAILFSWAALEAFSSPVSIEAARLVAKNLYSEAIFLQTGALPGEVEFSNVICIGDQQQPLMYAFNLPGNGGFIVIAGDDASCPVLCYALKGNFSALSEGRPEGVNLFMQGYERQLTEIVRLKLNQTSEIRETWNHYQSDKLDLNFNDDFVEPLLTTTWNQGCYYNDMCPVDAAGPCGRVPAGCCAAAMGQIMKYYQYPLQGTGEYGYNHPEYGYLSINFGATTYNWSQMNDVATETDHDEIAKLLYHCGVAAQMNYNPNGSATFVVPLINGMINYFGYSPNADLIFKDNYSYERWKGLIKTELLNNRPLIYSAASCDTCQGHTFICDGYQQDDFFHFNWGWSGNYNGYYLLSDLTPGTFNFTPFQKAVIGIVPDTLRCTPPLHLNAAVNSNDVTLTWSVPSPQPITEWIHYDDEFVTGTEFTSDINFKVAIRFDTAQLADYDGLKLTKIRMIVGDKGADYRLNIWKGENASYLLLDDPIPEEITLNWVDIYGNYEVIWNNFVLAQPIVIDASEELWVGYSCITTPVHKGSPGRDGGPSVTGYSDLIYFEGDYWRSMHLTFPSWNYNWSIEAFVTDVYGNTYPLKSGSSGLFIDKNTDEEHRRTASTSNEPALLGYNVFRDGNQLNTQLVTQLTYTDNDLADGTYIYTVTAVYDSGTSIPAGPAIATIGMMLEPPLQLEATASGPDVLLTWAEPLTSSEEEWIHYDDGLHSNCIGTGSAGSYNVAMRFTPEQLTEYDGMSISKVRLCVCTQNPTYQLFIAKGANASNIIINIPLTDLLINQWDTVTLSPPVAIDISQELWIGYKVINQPANDYAAGTDDGPAVAGYGDMISLDGTTYSSLFSLNPSLNYNWNIQALVSSQADKKSLLSTDASTSSLQLLGYNLYRNYSRVNNNTILETNWHDMGLPEGTYTYFVKALYEEGESGPSNFVSVMILVSVDETDGILSIKIFPNPATDFIMIETPVSFNQVYMYDNMGKEVYRYLKQSNKLKILTNSFEPGIYILKIQVDNRSVSAKVSIQ